MLEDGGESSDTRSDLAKAVVSQRTPHTADEFTYAPDLLEFWPGL